MYNQENSAHRCKEQIGGCQRWCVGVDEMGGESQRNSSYEISHGDIKYTMLSTVNNSVACLGVTKSKFLKFSLQEKM